MIHVSAVLQRTFVLVLKDANSQRNKILHCKIMLGTFLLNSNTALPYEIGFVWTSGWSLSIISCPFIARTGVAGL
jgi:hypothetical protein